jgi:hypothetical protein
MGSISALPLQIFQRLSFIILFQLLTTVTMSTTLDSSSQASIASSLISEEEPSPQSQRPFLARAFAPIGAGAMRGSIFALLASAMGTGMFNLPYRINEIGLGAYFLFVIAGGMFSYLGMYLISRLILKFKVSSYSEMC